MTAPATQDYPIPDDMAFQRRSWVVERVAWCSMGLVAVCAAVGLVSHGPLSRTTAAADGSRLTVTYEQLERRAASSRLTIRVPQTASGGETVLRFGREFLDTYEIRSMTPAPLRAAAGPEGFEASFAAASGGGSEVHITARARRFGFTRFAVEARGAGAVEVRQFIFP